MNTASSQRGWTALFSFLILFLILLAGASTAHAQLTNVGVRFHGGLAVPTGDFGEYFEPGVNFGVTALYPFRDRLGITVGLEVDHLNGYSYVPDTRLWRYKVGLEADLLAGTTRNPRLIGYLEGGGTSFRSDEFRIPQQGTQAQTFSKTYLSGGGGLRLAVDMDSTFTWWLSGGIRWSPMSEGDVEPLQQAALGLLEPFSSAALFHATVGLSIRR